MKKILLFAAAMMLAVSFNACTNEDNGDNDGNNVENDGDNNGGNNNNGDNGDNTGANPDVALVRKIVEIHSDGEFYSYDFDDLKYDSQNRIIKYGSNTLVYEGNKMNFGENYETDFIGELNADGSIATMTATDSDQYLMTNTYDNGYLIKSVEKYSDFTATFTYDWQNGNIATLTTEEDIDEEKWVWKYKFTYGTFDNPPINLNISYITLDGCKPWFGLLGFHGRQNAKLPIRIEQEEYSTIILSYELSYEFNDDGTVSKIIAHFDDDYEIVYELYY